MKHDAAITELLAKPSLEGLAYLLRHPALWPANFGPWDYSRYSTCAIGLAARLWYGFAHPDWIERSLDLDSDSVRRLFWRKRLGFLLCSPEHVARRIDNYLKETTS